MAAAATEDVDAAGVLAEAGVAIRARGRTCRGHSGGRRAGETVPSTAADRDAAPAGPRPRPPLAGPRALRLGDHRRRDRRVAGQPRRHRELVPRRPLRVDVPGDVGPQAATDAALAEFPEDATSYGLTLPAQRSGRLPGLRRGAAARGRSRDRGADATSPPSSTPAPGRSTRSRNEEAGRHVVAVPRAHVPVAGLRASSACSTPSPAGAGRTPTAIEPGGVKGVVCDVHPRRHGHRRRGCRRRLHRRAAHRLLPLVLAGRAPVGHRVRRPPRARSVHVQHVDAQGRRLRRLGPAARRRLHRGRLRVPEHEQVVRERDARPSATSTCGCPARTSSPRKPTGASRSGSTGRARSSDERYPDRAINYLATPVRRDRSLHGLGHARVRPVDPGGRRRQHLRRARPVHRRDASTTARPRKATSSTRRGTTGASRSTPATSAAPSTRVLWTVVGLSPLVLAITGVIMYVIRLQKRRRRSRRA